MKTIIVSSIFFILSLFSFGQLDNPEKFEYSENGINDYIVTKVENKSAEQIYCKTISWVKETFENPDKVLKMNIENEKLRINGVSSDLLFVKKMKIPLEYIIEIAFKDGKYKFDLISLRTSNEYGEADYKKIPNFKTDKKLVKNFGESPQRIEDYFNGLNQSLKKIIIGDSKKDDW